MGPDKAIEDEGINAMNYYYGFLVSSFLLHQLTSFTICFEEHMFCGHVQAILLEMNAGLVLLIYTCRVIVHWVTKKCKEIDFQKSLKNNDGSLTYLSKCREYVCIYYSKSLRNESFW